MATPHASASQNTPTWTEPPWSGWIETTGDALLILEAARRGLIPRVTRRLVDSERKMITSGSVFVFDEDESGIKRWTDGFFWSPSRILGNFLLYRETDRRGSGHRGGKDTETGEYDGSKNDGSLSRPKSDPGHPGVDKHRERTLVGSLTNSYKFKPDGLMKKTFSLTIGGVAQHLISYYKIEDVESGRLRPPSSLPELASLEISPEYLDKTHFRNPPKVEMGADGILRYRGEADDIETSTSLLTGPPLTGLPLLTDGRELPESAVPKRVKPRFEPYGSPNPAPKRLRKTPTAKNLNEPGDPSHAEQSQSEQDVITTPIASPTSPQQGQPSQPFSDPIVPATSPPVQAAPVTSYAPFGVPSYYGYMQPPHHPHMYPHQPPYPALSATQPLPPPTHPGQYQYSGYPPPFPAPQATPQASTPSTSPPVVPTSSNTPISPSDPSHSQTAAISTSSPQSQPQVPSQTQPTASTPPQVQPQPAYYHPAPGHAPHPYYHPPPHAPPVAAPHPHSHPQMYPGYPPPPAPHTAPPPTAVWGPPPHPHPYSAYPPPPHPSQATGPPAQSYSYGVYPPPQPLQQPGPGQYQQSYQAQQAQYVHQPQGYSVYGQKPDQTQGSSPVQESEALKTNGKTARELEREGSGISE